MAAASCFSFPNRVGTGPKSPRALAPLGRQGRQWLLLTPVGHAVVLSFLSTHDATFVRAVSRTWRTSVSDFAWGDRATLVSRCLDAWQASFPRAWCLLVPVGFTGWRPSRPPVDELFPNEQWALHHEAYTKRVLPVLRAQQPVAEELDESAAMHLNDGGVLLKGSVDGDDATEASRASQHDCG
jgi:hypothetical protein